MMVTLTKLLEIRMVARSLSESSSNDKIYLSDECFSSSTSFKSLGDKEKNAISEADTNPETKSKSTANTMATMAPIVGADTVTSLNKSAKWHKNESGSKELNFS